MSALASRPRCDLDRLAPIQRTLAIPLVGRAMAHRCFPELGFRDAVAERLLERVRFAAVGALEADRKAVWGTILRTQAFDEVCTRFAALHPRPTILHLGVGLCTRASRLDAVGAPLRWVEVDVADVMEARDALLPASAHTARLCADVGDPDALLEVIDRATRGTSGPVLVLAEGLLMFLDRATHLPTLETLRRRLPAGSCITFDYVHPIVARVSQLHPSLRATGARFRSGWIPGRDLRRTPGLSPSGLFPASLGLFGARLSRRLRMLQRALTFVARSPLYEIACLTVEAQTMDPEGTRGDGARRARGGPRPALSHPTRGTDNAVSGSERRR